MHAILSYCKLNCSRFLFLILWSLSILFFVWTLYQSRQYAYLCVFIFLVLLVFVFKKHPLHRRRLPQIVITVIINSLNTVCGKCRLSIILFVGFVLRFGWGLAYRVRPFSDFEGFFLAAQEFSKGSLAPLGTSKSPITVLWYGVLVRLFGDSLFYVYLFNALLGVLQIWLVYRIVYGLFESEPCAKLGALLIACMPSVFIHGNVVSSETPFATLMLLSLYSISKLYQHAGAMKLRKIWIYGIVFGLLIALLHLTRNLGVLIGICLLIVTLVFRVASGRGKAILAVSSLFVFLAVMLPQVRYNYRHYGVYSINSARWSGLNLLMGTRMTSGGKYNPRELSTIKGTAYDLSSKEASDYAFQVAMGRIREDPWKFIKFALTIKYRNMWGKDSSGISYYINSSKQNNEPESRNKVPATHARETRTRDKRKIAWLPKALFWARSADAYYYFVLFLALCSTTMLVRSRSETRMAFFSCVAGIIVVTALLHVFIEVELRYHFHCLFLFCILAGGILGGSRRPIEQLEIPPGVC
jgi:hypothetical protein